MNNSSYKIYSLYKRIPFVFNNEEEDNFVMHTSLDQPVAKGMFDHTGKYIKNQCYRIYNEIENSYYSYDDLTNFLIWRSLWDKAVDLPGITYEAIDNFKEKFTDKQLQRDKGVIDAINMQMKFPRVRDYFKIREHGESVIFRLCMKEIVSVYFFAYYADTLVAGYFQHPKLVPRQKEYKKFYETVKILKYRMNLKTFVPKKQEDKNI